MIKCFEEYIKESKDYPLYKGVSFNTFTKILDSGYITSDARWESLIRKNRGINRGISATRNFSYPSLFDVIIEFNTPKLTSVYKTVPFSENPDFYIDVMDDFNYKLDVKEKDLLKWLRDCVRNKDFGKIYWKVKTNREHDDFDIAEEVIVGEKIPNKYIKKVYLNTISSVLEEKLKSSGIQYQILKRNKKYLSQVRYGDKIKKFAEI
jgi:hypothetical protein